MTDQDPTQRYEPPVSGEIPAEPLAPRERPQRRRPRLR